MKAVQNPDMKYIWVWFGGTLTICVIMGVLLIQFLYPNFMRKLLLTLLLVLLPTMASAQVTLTGYELHITGTASSTYSFLASVVSCNVTSEPGNTGSVNPRYLIWDDSENAGRYCFHDTGNNTGPLFALPIGNYTANLVAVAGTDKSLPSNQVSFSRLALPAARTGFHVRVAQ